MKTEQLEIALCIEKLKTALTKSSKVGTLTITSNTVKLVTHDDIYNGAEGTAATLGRAVVNSGGV